MRKNTGVKIHGFSLMKFFAIAGIFSWYLDQQCFYLSIHGKTFTVLLKITKIVEVYSSISFPVYSVLNVCMHYDDVRLISVIFIC